jgi:hypothetical protein
MLAVSIPGREGLLPRKLTNTLSDQFLHCMMQMEGCLVQTMTGAAIGKAISSRQD